MPYNYLLVVIGLATAYFPGDRNNAGVCANGKAFLKDDWHIAHRTLPLGTKGVLCNLRTGLCVPVSVQDRGPFGMIRPCSTLAYDEAAILGAKRIKWKRRCHWWRAFTHGKHGWHYRGVADLTRPVARAVSLRPFDKVVFFYNLQDQTV